MNWKAILNPQELPSIDEPESETLDFKRDAYAPQKSDSVEIARDVAQFANRLGGVLLIGADEGSLSRLAGYVDVPEVRALTSRIEDVVNSRLHPRPRIQVAAIHKDEKTVIAVNVHPVASTCAIRVTDNRYEFWVRAGTRKRPMTYEEVELRSSSERRASLALESIPAGERGRIRIDARICKLSSTNWKLKGIQEGYFELLSPDQQVVTVPLAFVEAVWPSPVPGEHTICLNCEIRKVDEQIAVLRYLQPARTAGTW